ncbi:hypothetical protein AB0H37_44515 [Actinomadura sp. NPDC023710]|uniref:hypothetical protein n=1 Tax=Actinomadura sp. NPDC023710 TaxID=3158219 RepID=UPI0033D2FADF
MMSLPTAFSLCSLLVSAFAMLAVGAVYSRLRMLERTALNPGSTLLIDELPIAPKALQPTGNATTTLVLLLSNGCSVCGVVWRAAAEYVATHDLAGSRLVALFASQGAAGTFGDAPGLECVVDPGMWSALSEGYTPCLYLIGTSGRVTDRRFVYTDTDVSALLAGLARVTDPTGSHHAL